MKIRCICGTQVCGWPDRCGVVVVGIWRPRVSANGEDADWLDRVRMFEVVGSEGFRTPHWSAGLLHLHFSVALGCVVGWMQVFCHSVVLNKYSG